MTTKYTSKLLTDIFNHHSENVEAVQVFSKLYDYQKITAIQTALSNTVDGKPVCEFLGKNRKPDFVGDNIPFFVGDVLNKHINHTDNPDGVSKCSTESYHIIQKGSEIGCIRLDSIAEKYNSLEYILENYTKVESTDYELIERTNNITLNHLLYQTFTTALFHGKDVDTALEETNKIYLENIN